MKRVLFICILFALLLSACGSSQTAPTATSLPTNTPIPTSTATPIPMIEVDGVKVPDPKASNPELFDQKNPDSSLMHFISETNKAGINIEAQKAIEELSKNYQPIKGADGTTYIFTHYTTSNDSVEKMSLAFVWSEENGWQNFQLKQAGEISGILTTTSIDGYDVGLLNDPIYGNLFSEYFQGVEFTMDYGLNTNEKSQSLKNMVDFANKNGLDQVIGWGFTHWAKQGIKDFTSAQLKDFMVHYPEKIFQYVSENKGTGSPVMVNFFGEPFFGDPSSGVVNYLKDSIFYRAFDGNGIKMFTQSYMDYYNAASSKGLVLGKDYRLNIGLDGVYSPNIKASFAHSQLVEVKKRIAKELNIDVKDVQLDVFIPLRININDRPRDNGALLDIDLLGYYSPLAHPEQVKEALKLFSDIGPVHISEFEIDGTPGDSAIPEAIVNYNQQLLDFAKENPGNLKSISYYRFLRSVGSNVPSPEPGILSIHDHYKATFYYYELISQYLELIGVNN